MKVPVLWSDEPIDSNPKSCKGVFWGCKREAKGEFTEFTETVSIRAVKCVFEASKRN
jgi:hypothetical protein